MKVLAVAVVAYFAFAWWWIVTAERVRAEGYRDDLMADRGSVIGAGSWQE